ncbi:hypothetical protein CC80DRAFT_537909 [Byssothecium circinans]|uniref:Zn(2)-C6 fungal-type domain-containing protein n=1 Tax=Byssothecium circinans TaxID=147558 RepID=A0A6A5TVA3_9PLEO|nr:hypothetical protein CC80DRAFT_537909 [Byssothecium circinans]
MVYRGKPSTGCKKCRQRKIKCDETPGSCLKCTAKGTICPGYENSVDLFFHDESASVQVKAEKAKAKAIIARDEREKASRAKAALAKMKDAVGTPLLAPMIDQAISFFMLNMAWGLDSPPINSKYYHRHLHTYGFHPIIATCMTALGLAGVANICMDVGLKRESTKWYTEALNMTNKAIMDPVEVTSDNTLLATMLLSVFESTMNEKSLVGWSNHVSGSALLLKMRGRKQFSTPAGRRMWLQIVGQVTIQCMGMGEGIPKFIHDFHDEVNKWDMRDPGIRFYHLHIDTIELRAQIIQNKITDLQTIVKRALELDKAAEGIMEDMGKDWSYEVEYCDLGTPGVFGTSYHIYPHLAAAQTWNWIRYNRIYLHDIIRNSLVAGFSTSPPVFTGMECIRLLETSTEILYEMQSDIIASIPQYLHDTPKSPVGYSGNDKLNQFTTPIPPQISSPPQPSSQLHPSNPNQNLSPFSPIPLLPASASTSPSAPSPSCTPKLLTANFHSIEPPSRTSLRSPAQPKDKLPIIRVSGGYSSIWALFIAGSTPVASPESQEFILKTLERVSGEFGINQARVMAGALRLKMQGDRLGMVWGGKGGCGGLGEGERGGWSGIAPVYMPLVGPHFSEEMGEGGG